MEYQLLAAEMETLRSQMNPHFIFNALNSMQGFIFGEDKKNASRFLHKFSTLIRNSLNYSKSEFISLNEELEFIKNYLEIENIRFDNQFVYFFEDNGIDKVQLKVPPLIIQPLVENSIKHGFSNLNEREQIRIECIQKKDVLEIIVSDNGKGIHEGDPLKPGSYGLQNIIKRLTLLGRDKPQAYQLKINDQLKSPWKTSIKIELPILI
jgi:LytS/YehU family sensor histidine kinase